MDEALRAVRRGSRARRADRARSLSRGAARSAGDLLFRYRADLWRPRPAKRPAGGLAVAKGRRAGRPDRNHPAEHPAIPHRNRRRLEAWSHRRHPQSDVPHARTQEALRRLRAEGGHLPRRPVGHRIARRQRARPGTCALDERPRISDAERRARSASIWRRRRRSMGSRESSARTGLPRRSPRFPQTMSVFCSTPRVRRASQRAPCSRTAILSQMRSSPAIISS